MTFCKLKITLGLVATLTLAATVAGPLTAQVTAADSAAVLLDAGQDFERRDLHDVARALYRLVAERYPDTPAGRAALAFLGDTGPAGVPGAAGQPEGDTELKVFSTLYGIWLGTALPAALQVESPQPYGLGLLAGGPVGYFGGRAFARSRPLSLGQARTINWGGTWGIWQGMGWARAMDLGGGERLIEGDIVIYEDEAEHQVVAAMIAGGVVGLAGGALAARKEIRNGTALSAALGSVWGTWIGFASSVFLELDPNPSWATTMVAGNVGLLGGAVAGSRWSISGRRARLISLSGLIGGFAGLGIVIISETENVQAAIGLPLAGSVAGLGFGVATTRDRGGADDVSGAEAAEPLALPGALLSRAGGNWSFSAPMLSPLWERPRVGGGKPKLAWRVPLVNVRF